MTKRSEKLAFMKVIDGSAFVYKRMSGFTELSVSKNPKEYSRKYIDEDSERNSVVGYSTSISYKLDYEPENPVHKAIVQVTDYELTGANSIKDVVIVDLTTTDENGICHAIKREFAIVPSVEGNDSEAYTFSGNLKASGEMISGTAESDDGWQTITFNEAE